MAQRFGEPAGKALFPQAYEWEYADLRRQRLDEPGGGWAMAGRSYR